LRGLAKKKKKKNTFITKSADIVPIWQRNRGVSSPVNSHHYTFTNNTVPIKEPIVSNSTFDDFSCDSKGEFSGYYTIYFKDVTSLFYYFRFNW